MTEFGVGTYTRNVVRALGRLDRHNQYFLMGPPQKMAEIGPLPSNFQSVPLLDGDTTVKGSLAFRSILRNLSCDLVHIPHLFWLPRALPCPYVMTVHDVLEHMYRAHGHSGCGAFCIFNLHAGCSEVRLGSSQFPDSLRGKSRSYSVFRRRGSKLFTTPLTNAFCVDIQTTAIANFWPSGTS